ncbi:MAG: glycosyltransferase family 39 protein [Candidatus Omnitrophica bacterium]|nr:glycosyltransferase family 39 protein [Candidatus Omnitrophota bacterium]MDD5435928.1 glycosyltransferase family 39 protein [Candidatus Omnitrophota bacterium]
MIFTAEQKKAGSVLLVIALLFIGLLLRSINIDKEISGDEALIMGICSQDFNTMVGMFMKADVYPPLPYMVVHYMLKVNKAVAFIRSYFVLFGLGACLIIYLLAKEYFNITVARLALTLSVFSPISIFTSQYIRSYIDSAFWILLSCLFMLKLLKGKDRLAYWLGYVLAAAVSLYTFYLSALLIVAQAVFVTILLFRDKKRLLKWYAAFLLVGLCFLPWLPSAIHQYNNISIDNYDWSQKGFNIGPLRVGLYIRNIFSVIGFDPFFMVFRDGAASHFSGMKALLTASGLTALFIAFIYYVRSLKKGGPRLRREPAGFFYFLLLAPLLMLWIMAGAFNILPNARYLVVLNGFFLIIAASAISEIFRAKRVLGILAGVLLIGIFASRIASAVGPEFEYKKASSFIEKNMPEGSYLICVSVRPELERPYASIDFADYIKLNDKKSAYVISSAQKLEEVKGILAKAKKIWFYRVYGNMEVFGANNIVEELLKREGYSKKDTDLFKNIDITRYEK